MGDGVACAMGVLKIVSLMGGLLVSWAYLNLAYLLPLQDVFVVGDVHTLPPGIVDKALVGVQAKSYFSDAGFLIKRLSDTGWVRSIRIKRQYPGRWWVFFTPRKPVLRLSTNAMLDDEGDVMSVVVPRAYRELPVVEVVGDRYKQAYSLWRVLFVHDVTMLAKLKTIGFDDDEGWVLLFSDNIKLKLGYHSQQHRLVQFLKVLKAWGKSGQVPNQVYDFRYKNGFSHKKGVS